VKAVETSVLVLVYGVKNWNPRIGN